jgi:uncharacterized membrane protein
MFMHIAEKRIEIRAPVERVFDLFSDFESFPRWMKNIREVRRTGRRFTRWAAEAPLGTEVEWEAELIRFEPDHRIVWRSVRGDIDTEGEVVFEETRRGTTLVRVVLGYALPAGRLGELVARLFGRDPDQQLAEDLERFAAVVERRMRHPYPARDRREHDYHAAARQRPAPEEERPGRERRARPWEDERLERDERQEERRRPEADARYEDGQWRRTRRHALTPREREMERETREPDYDYSEQAFRRGVDKLLNEPPSRRWRHWN